MSSKIAPLVLLGIFSAAGVAIKDPYFLGVGILILLYATIALSIRLVLKTGQFTIGHAAFMAIGAYSSYTFVVLWGVTFWISLILSGAVAGILGLIIGYPTLKVKGVYFAIISLAFCDIVQRAIAWSPRDLFGGHNGLSGIPKPGGITIPGLWRIDFNSRTSLYFLALVLAVATYIFIHRLEFSKTGKNFLAIREDDALAESVGINILRYKLLAFVTAAFITGMMGSFYAHFLGYLNPRMFSVWLSIIVVMYIIVGGMGSLVGPIIGAATLLITGESLRFIERVKGWEQIIFGAIIIASIFFLPEGLVSLPRRLARVFSTNKKLES